MLTMYAKNMAGELLTLSLPYGVTAEGIRRAICPDDPSSVRLVARREAGKGTKADVGMTDDALQGLMDELCEMASEVVSEEEEEEEEESLEMCSWANGDTVEYWVESEELTVTLTPPLGGPYYSTSDPDEIRPLYPFTVWLDKSGDEGRGKSEGDEKQTVYSWTFLFSLRDGRYCAPSEFAMEVEGGGGEVVLALRASCVWHDTVFAAIRADGGIPARYKEKMLRAVYRKWTRTLRMMARRTLEERRVGAMYPTEYLEGERAMFKQCYYALRAGRHDVAGRA